VIKPSGEKAKVFRLDKLSPKWSTKRSFDKPIIEAFCGELSSYDIVAGHNHVKFDLGFLRTRLLRWGLPPLREFKAAIDSCQMLRNKFKLSWNSLDRATDFLGTNQKTPVNGDTWLQASLDGNTKAMNEIVAHCLADVEMTEDLIIRLKDYSTKLNCWGSAY
jgi:DNA polymerase III epsilon subunit-like protein